MLEFSSVFKNGGPNYSFGRTFAGLVIVVGLAIIGYAAVTDLTPYQVTKRDAAGVTYVETQFKRKVDGANLQSLMIGIATLAGAVYGMSKLGAAAQTYAGGNGANANPVPAPPTPNPIPSADSTPVKKEDPPQDPKPPIGFTSNPIGTDIL